MSILNPITKTCLLVLFLLIFTACSDNNEEESTNLEEFPLGEDPTSTLVISWNYDEEEGYVGFVNITLLEETNEISVQVNGNEKELYNMYEDYPEEYPEEVKADYISLIDITPGETVSYALTIDGNTTSGSLTVPTPLSVEYPDFDFDSDLELTWETEDDPTGFMIVMNNPHHEDYLVDYEILEGTHRTYTFSKDLYAMFSDEEYFSFYINLHAFDFNIDDEMLYMAFVEDRYAYNIYSGENFKVEPSERSHQHTMRMNLGSWQHADSYLPLSK